MAYGFQYIPRERGRPVRAPVGPGQGAEAGRSEGPHVFAVTPTARAIADVIEAIYRDIDDLRISVPDLPSDADAVPGRTG